MVNREGLPLQQVSLGIQQLEAAQGQGQGLEAPFQALLTTQPTFLQLPPPLGMESFHLSCQWDTGWVLPQKVVLLEMQHFPWCQVSPLYWEQANHLQTATLPLSRLWNCLKWL